VRHRAIGVADTPQGVLLLLPPSWVGRTQKTWLVAMVRPNPESSNLLNRGARILAQLTPAVGNQTMSVSAITEGYALVTASMSADGGDSEVLWSVNLTTGQLRRLHQWDLDQTNGPPFVAGRGVVAWWNQGTGHGTAVDLATGESQVVPDIGSAAALGWQNGALWANGTAVRLSFLTPYVHRLPAAYRWLGSPPVIAIPDTWQQSFNGSNVSDEAVSASQSLGSPVKVVVTVSHCEGCYLPGQVSNRVNSLSGPDSPELTLPAGTLLFWLSDHAIAYTLPTTVVGYRTYGVTVTGPQGGMVRAEVTVPPADKGVATTILNSLWWP